MGKGFLKERNKVRTTQFNQIVREAQRLEAENRELKTNPEGVVGKFLRQLEIVSQQNNKLSSLAASLIQTCGGSVHVSRALIESFTGNRVTIKVEGNAEKESDVTDYLFSYTSVPANESTAPITVDPPVVTPITVNDPRPIPPGLVAATTPEETEEEPRDHKEDE